MLWAAAASDLFATHFRLTIEGVIRTLQVLLIVAPILAFWMTKKIALALQRKDRELVLHGYESSRIVRLPGGEYQEIHYPLDKYEQWKLVSYDEYAPAQLRPNKRGKITVGARMRSSLSRFYFEDRIAPVTTKELESSHHGHH
jgi:ubiquinol-cytochrome c reductase cytochrome b subunit